MRCRRRNRRRQRRLGWFFKANRGDEIVAPSWNGGDVATAALAIAQGAAQGADLDLQICVFDERLRPGWGYQLFLADNLAGAFDQSGQNGEGPAAQPHRCVALKKQPLRRKEAERNKRDRRLIACGCLWLSRGGDRLTRSTRILLRWEQPRRNPPPHNCTP